MAVALTAPTAQIIAVGAGAARSRYPTLDHEAWLWDAGFARVAGVDEAGRGALAGPLVAAAVILPPCPMISATLAGVRDSKLLSARARATLFAEIHACALAVGVAVIPSATVDAAGLSAAGQLAFRQAVAALEPAPDFLLLDAFRLRAASVPQLPLIHGDARCLSIAAASVVAKVTRDDLMEELHQAFPQYGFDRHKGYGTVAHQTALGAHGVCPQHRRSYAPVRALCRH